MLRSARMTEPCRMIAIAFGPATMAEALEGLPRIREAADCVELRLDYFEESFDLHQLLSERGDLAVVVTMRPPDQGGHSQLAASERLPIVLEAARLGADYIDLEYDAATPEAIARIRAEGARVILSRHDFSAMPDMARWWDELNAKDPDVVKVVGTASDVRDCLPVLDTLS